MKQTTKNSVEFIYGLVETDLFNNTNTNFLKVGKGSNRDSGTSVNDRRNKLQTGNPRFLDIAFQIQTNASVSTLETQIHQRLSPKRVHGEWFINNNDMDPIIKIIEEINEALESQIDDDNIIEKLNEIEDNQNLLIPDSESKDIYQEIINLTKKIELINSHKEKLELNLKFFKNENLSNIDGICSYAISKPAARLDTASFKKSFPEIVKKIGINKINSRFSISKPSKKKDEKTALLNKKFKSLLSSASSFNTVDRDEISETLHSDWLKNHAKIQPLELKKKMLEKKLKVITGENSGIEGICSWNRKIEKKFTKSDVEKYDLELSKKFIITGKEKINFKINNFRPYKFLIN